MKERKQERVKENEKESCNPYRQFNKTITSVLSPEVLMPSTRPSDGQKSNSAWGARRAGAQAAWIDDIAADSVARHQAGRRRPAQQGSDFIDLLQSVP